MIDEIREGSSGKDPDLFVREIFGDRAKFFGHGLGHGVGLEIHEEPRLSRLSRCARLEENMVVTDEPGIYIEGFGGVRIEDTTLVGKTSAETLTHSPKSLIELSN